MLLTVIFGLVAGATFATGGVLQQREASREQSSDSASAGILGGLLKRKWWVAGIALDAVSYGFKALGLAFGAWAVVQPMMASEVLFALPPSVRRHGHKLGRREWTAAGLVVGGLGLVIFAAQPTRGDPLIGNWQWVFLLGALIGLAALAFAVGQRREGNSRASLFALAATVLLAGMGALMTATVELFKSDGLTGALSTWQPYAMAVFAIAGTTLQQNSYSAGPLAASMPVIDSANPLLAMTIGISLFNETINTSPLALIGTVAGVAALIGGIVILDRSPLVEKVQQEESDEGDEDDEGGNGEGEDDRADGEQGAAAGAESAADPGRRA